MLKDSVLAPNGLSSGPEGSRLELRLAWYRSLPLSCVGIENLSIDGQSIAPEDMRIELEGSSYALPATGDLTHTWWFVRDSAWLHLPGLHLASGAVCDVQVLVTLFPPYIPGLAWKCPAHQQIAVQGAQS